MNGWAARLLARRPARDGCRTCRFFVSEPHALQAALPGLGSLSSAQGSVWGDDGLCERHSRFTGASSTCSAHAKLGHA